MASYHKPFSNAGATSSRILCHQIFLSQKRISIQATRQFIGVLRNSDGFGGVELTDDGGGWYSLIPRSELGDGTISDALDRQLFLAFAWEDLLKLTDRLAELDGQAPRVTVVPSTVDAAAAPAAEGPHPVKNNNHGNRGNHGNHGYVTRFALKVSAPLSTAMPNFARDAEPEHLRKLILRYNK